MITRYNSLFPGEGVLLVHVGDHYEFNDTKFSTKKVFKPNFHIPALHQIY